MAKPTAVKRRQGTLQNCRVNQREPERVEGVPAPTVRLEGKVAYYYECLAADAQALGVLSRTDGVALQAAAHVMESIAILEDMKTQALKDEDNELALRAMTRLEAQYTKLRAFVGDFGLTPVARTKVESIHVGPKQQNDNVWDDPDLERKPQLEVVG